MEILRCLYKLEKAIETLIHQVQPLFLILPNSELIILKVCCHFTIFSLIVGTTYLVQVQLIEIKFKALLSFIAPRLDQ